MFCNKCGANLPEGSTFCSTCGTPVGAPAAGHPVYSAVPVAQPGKGLAIAAMILGIISFFCAPIVTGVLGIIFGGVAKYKGYRGGMATAGIVCGVIGVAAWLVMVIAFQNTSMMILNSL